MNQHSAQEVNLEAYVLGALDAGDCEAFESHLLECAQCQHELASYAYVLHELHKLPPPMPPRIPELRKTFLRLSRTLYPIAAVLLLALGTFARASFVPTQNNDMVTVAAMAATSSKEMVLSGVHVEGRAIVGMRRQRTAFVLAGLPPPPSGHGYQVWLLGRTASSPGMLRRNGNYEVLVVPGDILEDVNHVTVTIEPSGGSASMGQFSVAQDES